MCPCSNSARPIYLGSIPQPQQVPCLMACARSGGCHARCNSARQTGHNSETGLINAACCHSTRPRRALGSSADSAAFFFLVCQEQLLLGGVGDVGLLEEVAQWYGQHSERDTDAAVDRSLNHKQNHRQLQLCITYLSLQHVAYNSLYVIMAEMRQLQSASPRQPVSITSQKPCSRQPTNHALVTPIVLENLSVMIPILVIHNIVDITR